MYIYMYVYTYMYIHIAFYIYTHTSKKESLPPSTSKLNAHIRRHTTRISNDFRKDLSHMLGLCSYSCPKLNGTKYWMAKMHRMP